METKFNKYGFIMNDNSEGEMDHDEYYFEIPESEKLKQFIDDYDISLDESNIEYGDFAGIDFQLSIIGGEKHLEYGPVFYDLDDDSFTTVDLIPCEIDGLAEYLYSLIKKQKFLEDNNMTLKEQERELKMVDAVRELAKKIGYGNMMDLASALWAIDCGNINEPLVPVCSLDAPSSAKLAHKRMVAHIKDIISEKKYLIATDENRKIIYLYENRVVSGYLPYNSLIVNALEAAGYTSL